MTHSPTITPADREAAASVYREAIHPGIRREILEGHRDHGREVLSFATHRETHTAPLEARIAELEAALRHIASYPHGGVTIDGECSGDRSDMILTARQALEGRK